MEGIVESNEAHPEGISEASIIDQIQRWREVVKNSVNKAVSQNSVTEGEIDLF